MLHLQMKTHPQKISIVWPTAYLLIHKQIDIQTNQKIFSSLKIYYDNPKFKSYDVNIQILRYRSQENYTKYGQHIGPQGPKLALSLSFLEKYQIKKKVHISFHILCHYNYIINMSQTPTSLSKQFSKKSINNFKQNATSTNSPTQHKTMFFNNYVTQFIQMLHS